MNGGQFQFKWKNGVCDNELARQIGALNSHFQSVITNLAVWSTSNSHLPYLGHQCSFPPSILKVDFVRIRTRLHGDHLSGATIALYARIRKVKGHLIASRYCPKITAAGHDKFGHFIRANLISGLSALLSTFPKSLERCLVLRQWEEISFVDHSESLSTRSI